MPLGVRLHTQVITGLNLAIAAAHRAHPERGDEIGGLLLGRIENPTPARPIIHIERFDPIESEHRRGPSYDLSERDKRVLARKLAWWNSHGQKENLRPVGFYRTHARRGLYLDNDDRALLENYFPELHTVVLLVRPEAAGSVGGFFFWEDGDIHRESSYQEFPFDAVRLPLAVEPAAATPVAAAPAAAEPAPPPMPPPVPRAMPAGRISSNWARMALPAAVGLIAGAIVYRVAVHKSAGPSPAPTAAAATRSARPAPTVAAMTPPAPAAATPAPPAVEPIEKPSPFPAKPKPVVKPPAQPAPVRPAPAPPPNPNGSASRADVVARPEPPAPVHTEPAPTIAAAPPPPAVMAPITTPVRIEQPKRPARHATVTVEPVSGSRIGRVVGHIPGLGRLGKKDKGFVPARPIRQITPAVPAGDQLERDVPVDVKVTVDPAGNVSSVDSHGGDKELARLAVDAARSWQFVPARRNDETVSSELILHFTFKGASAEP